MIHVSEKYIRVKWDVIVRLPQSDFELREDAVREWLRGRLPSGRDSP